MKTVAEILRWRARQRPEGSALWYDDRELSYRQLDERASQVANALIAAGVQPGDRVCVLDKSHDAFFEVMFGIAKAGAVYTPVNWRLAPPEIAFVVDDAAAPALFAGPEFVHSVLEVREDLPRVRTIVTFGEAHDGLVAYKDFRDGAADSDPRRDSDENETAWQLYTSGTTGHPKGAEITHRNLTEVISVGVVGFGGILEGDSALVCMPLYHIGGSGYALAAFYGGARLVVLHEADPGTILKRMGDQRITHAFLVPALMNFLVQHPDSASADFSALRAILYGASPIPEGVLTAAIERFGCQFIQAYGLTETTGAVVLLPAHDHVPGNPRLKACGLPIFGTHVEIRDEQGKACPPGTVGEITIHGPMVMKGYWNRPEATAEAIRDGWFHSGDAGFVDEDGYLYIHDRVKDMIVSGGENVYPAEIESVLFGHPEVADVAVIGVPDERWGESVKAVVVATDGSELTEEVLIDYCRDKLAGFKRPRSVDFVDVLPRNPTGKILKRELRKPYWEGRDRQVN
jgi:acyl-CoA synthetase (AMP-forming)/AMP-acid ligase II